MQFVPKTEEECKRKLLTGECSFVVKEATERPDKQDMETKLELTSLETGESTVVFHYVNPKMPHLHRHFMYSIGLGHRYEQGETNDAECVGQEGRCTARIEKAKAGSGFQDQTRVADFSVDDSTKNTPGYQAAKHQGDVKNSVGTPPAAGTGAPAGMTPAQVRYNASKKAAFEKFALAYGKAFPNTSIAKLQEEFKNAAYKYFGSPEATKAATGEQLDKFAADNFIKAEKIVIAQPGATGDDSPTIDEADIPF